IPSSLREEAHRMIVEVLETGVALRETVRRRKDGSTVEVDVAMRAVRQSGGGIHFIAVTERHMTDRRGRRVDRALEARFRTLMDAAPDAMVIVGGDGRIVLANTQT